MLPEIIYDPAPIIAFLIDHRAEDYVNFLQIARWDAIHQGEFAVAIGFDGLIKEAQAQPPDAIVRFAFAETDNGSLVAIFEPSCGNL